MGLGRTRVSAHHSGRDFHSLRVGVRPEAGVEAGGAAAAPEPSSSLEVVIEGAGSSAGVEDSPSLNTIAAQFVGPTPSVTWKRPVMAGLYCVEARKELAGIDKENASVCRDMTG